MLWGLRGLQLWGYFQISNSRQWAGGAGAQTKYSHSPSQLAAKLLEPEPPNLNASPVWNWKSYAWERYRAYAALNAQCR